MQQAPVRLRVHLAFPAPDVAPSKFWWAPEPGARTVADVMQQLGTHLGLEAAQSRRLAAAMDGFAVLGSSRAVLLRDGDTLVVSLGRKRESAGKSPQEVGEEEQPAAKRRAAAAGAPAVAASSASSEEESSEEESSSSEETKSSSEEESSSSEEGETSSGSEGGKQQQDFQTPATATAPTADQGTTGKKPSRSARRKAAKRRLRRMGMLPAGGRGEGAAAAAALQVNATSSAAAAGGIGAAATVTAAAAGAHGKQPACAAQQVSGKQAAGKQAPASTTAKVGKQEQKQRQPAALPEVTVPLEWQAGSGAQHVHHQKQQQQQQQQREWQPQRARQAEQAAAACVAPQPPMSDAAFAQLPTLAGAPCVGDVLAYRLLEIGANLQPTVSEVRFGRVVDATAPCITLEPHPNREVHPLAYQRLLRRAQRLAAAAAAGEMDEAGGESEEEEEDDGPGSQYDEEGMLTAELASFVELRVVQLAPGQHSRSQHPVPGAPMAVVETAPVAGLEPNGGATTAAAPAAATPSSGTGQQAAAAGGDGELGPASYSRLGPPRPAAARGDVIAAEGGWASLYEQLRQRRSQLAQGAAGGDHEAPAFTPRAPAPAARTDSVDGVHTAPPAVGGRSRSGDVNDRNGGARKGLTPGATKPRAGVRRTAMGPMLRMLRDTQELS